MAHTPHPPSMYTNTLPLTQNQIQRYKASFVSLHSRKNDNARNPFTARFRIAVQPNSVGAQRGRGGGGQLNMFSCPIWKVLHVYMHTRTLALSRTYVWHITAKQFSAISANRGKRRWRGKCKHSNLILSLKLILHNNHHQIWHMGLLQSLALARRHMVTWRIHIYRLFITNKEIILEIVAGNFSWK